MSIKDGQELLEKLEHLDPDLIMEAGREPEKVERHWGIGIGTWIALAACLCVICLPMVLRQVLIPEGGPDERTRATGAAGGDTSHQAEGAVSVEMVPDFIEEYASEEECVSRMMKQWGLEMGIQQYIPGDDDPDGWTEVHLTQKWVETFPDGLPAEEYFTYNARDTKDGLLWEDRYDSDFGSYCYYNGDLLSGWLPGKPGWRQSWCTVDLDKNGRAQAVRLQYYLTDLDESLGRDTQYLTINIWEQKEETDFADTPEMVAYLKQHGETHVWRDGMTIIARGSVDTERTLTFWRDGMMFRIYAGKNVPPWAMVEILDPLLRDPIDLRQFTGENVTYLKNLQEYPDAFAGYYPTDSRWVPVADTAWLDFDGGEPCSLELQYKDNSPEQPITYWLAGTAEYANEDILYTALDGYLADLTEEDVVAYLKEMWADGKNYASFWWNEDIKVAFWYKEGTKPQELWEFFQYLQSDEVKVEKKIGEIVKLQPYAVMEN